MFRSANQHRRGRQFLASCSAIAAGGAVATLASPPVFSLDPLSPSVTSNGRNAAQVMEKRAFTTAPPPLVLLEASDLGLVVADNIDAFSVNRFFLFDAIGIYHDGNNYYGNCIWWSIDRASVGRTGDPDVLCDFAAGAVICGGTPEHDETTDRNESACGDLFFNIFDGPTSSRFNFTMMEESDLDAYAGQFTDPAGSLDEVDAFELSLFSDGGREQWVFFSVDPPTAAALGVSPAAILVADLTDGQNSWQVYKTPEELGLVAGDDIDGMQVMAFESELDDRGLPELFSVAITLARGSPSLTERNTLGEITFTWRPGDIFLLSTTVPFIGPYPGLNTFCDTPDHRCWIHAEYLGMLGSDNMDGLIVRICDPGVDCDLNGNGAVDLPDLSILLGHFGAQMVERHEGDIDGDGDVDLTDLSRLLANYGSARPSQVYP